MIQIKYSIRFFIDNRDGRVMCRVRWNSRKYEVSFVCGVYAQDEKWDTDMQKAKRGTIHIVRGKSFNAAEINDCISQFKEVIETSFTRCSLNNSIPTPNELKAMVNTDLGRDIKKDNLMILNAKTLSQLFEEFMETCAREKNWQYRCKIRYDMAFRHLIEAIPDITPHNITIESMYTLRQWFLDREYNNRTTNKNCLLIKVFFRWIDKQPGYAIPSEVLQFSTKLKVLAKSVNFLSYDELIKLYKCKFDAGNSHLERARDLWVFLASTSLRYSDLADLRPVHIIEGGLRLQKYTQKTDELISIPLTDIAKEIIKKYSGSEYKHGLLFPVISNQKMNEYIKEAAKIAGLDRLASDVYLVGTKRVENVKKICEIISCHTARRTFVSLSLAMGIRAEVVMACTGHRDIKTMQVYLATANETQALEMERWNTNTYRSQIITLLNKANGDGLKKILENVRMITQQ